MTGFLPKYPSLTLHYKFYLEAVLSSKYCIFPPKWLHPAMRQNR